MSAAERRRAFVERFVASFGMLDEMLAIEDLNPIAWELPTGEPDEYGRKRWRPARRASERSVLDSIYSQTARTISAAFELLVLSYRWDEVDLELFTATCRTHLGPDLDGLLNEMSKTVACRISCIPRGYVQFGKGPDTDYDPVCFDISSRKKNGDYKILKIDHEEILC